MPVVTDVTTELAAAVDRLCDTDPAVLADAESIVALHRQLARLEAATTRAMAAFDASRRWEEDGARSAATWVAVRCDRPDTVTRREVRLGRALRHMAEAEQAWLAGDVNDAHVSLLVGARGMNEECFERDEAVLVAEARRLRYSQFTRVLAYWCQLADPHGTEDRAEAQRQARRFHLSQTFEGTWVADGAFDPLSGSIVARALKKIEDELFHADWDEAKGRLGDTVRSTDLARTPAQRRADAVVEMARRSQALPAGARLPDPLVTVVVGYETLHGRICELANGTVVSPGALLPWLTSAWVERVVFTGRDRPMNVGVRRRLFSGATRRAIEVRDAECFHPYCDTPAEDCQIDHVEPWSAGGLTTDDNGRPACAFHNRERHRPRPPPPPA